MKNLFMLLLAFALPLIFVSLLLGNRDDYWKDYIINNQEKIYKYDDKTYFIDFSSGYYRDLSISVSDSSFYVIVWGLRDSYLWTLKKDYQFECSIPYSRFKGYDVSKEIEILKILKSCQKK